MADHHQLACWADELFYDTPARMAGGDAYEACDAVPAGWSAVEHQMWTLYRPTGPPLPAQGWKVHVSATPESAERVLRVVAAFCISRGTAFKHLRNAALLVAFGSKYVPRPSSGKFVTVYPRDDRELGLVLDVLGPRLAGETGPYVLSDLRWRDGPLSVRYGGFTERHCLTADGEAVLAVSTPAGDLVPDRRGPLFSVPAWVRPPAFLSEQIVEATADQGGGLPYRVLQCLHQSNAGGVYLAEHPAIGGKVVLKEARPHAGLDLRGMDAVARLEHEQRTLERLAGIPGIPRVLDRLTAWEHEFLVLEHLPGDVLWAWLGRRHPMLDPRSTEADVAEFTGEALDLLARVEALVSVVHRRGVVLGDLHPGNILVDASGSAPQLGLVDFEVAGDALDVGFRPSLGAPGFLPPRDRSGMAVDAYALAALRLWTFMPYHGVWGMDGGGAVPRLTAAVDRTFPVPTGWTAAIRRELAPRPGAVRRPAVDDSPLEVDLDGPDPDWAAVRTSMADALVAAATPDRRDRLFPGDLLQLSYDGVCVAYGAAGVLWAMAVGAGRRCPELESWLLDAVDRGLASRPGFFTGLHGVAHVLDLLGHRDRAMPLLEQAGHLLDRVSGVSLFSGLSGAGLNLLHLAARTGESCWAAEAGTMAERVGEALEGTGERAPDGSAAAVGRHSRRHAGLLRGWSGPALLFLRMWQHGGDPAWLDLAVRALHRDLDQCVATSNGSLQVEEPGVRTLAYLDGGSSGIALVATQVLRHRSDDRLSETLAPVVLACSADFVAEAQLFMGRAGLLGTLAMIGDAGGSAARDGVRRHLRRLAWHLVPYQGHAAVLGDRSHRLSMDLATGTAGVLASVAAATSRPCPPLLPLLDDPGSRAPGPCTRSLAGSAGPRTAERG